MRDRRGLPDLVLLIVALALLGIGIVMVFSASSVTSFYEQGDPYHYLKRQSLWAVIGLAGLLLAMRINYHVWEKTAGVLAVVGVGSLALVLVPGIGKLVAGSRRWLGFGFARFQPSEFAKLFLVMWLAAYLSGPQERVKDFLRGIIVPLSVVGVAALLVFAEPDLGTAITLVGVGGLTVMVAGCNVGHLLGIGSLAVPVIYLLAKSEPYRMRRLTSFMDPWADPLDSGFHIIQSLLALGSGGLVGVGLGLSRQKCFYLPEQHTDFIFAIIGEELGFLGTATVIALYVLFAVRGFRTAMQAPDAFGSVLAAGITVMIALQALMNIAVVTGSMPITGITLPLISAGGSSLLPTLASIGILLNISSHVGQR
ncbi:MAG: putative lipid II flippase FtsW [Clostridia bacterium]|nr:putative lipid II flippase FtsW [Clostridia bacterium]